MYSKNYKKFVEFWDSLDQIFVDHPKSQQVFFFDFLFRLILTIRHNLTADELDEVKLIATRFYELPLSEVELKVKVLSCELPKFQIDPSNSFMSMSGDKFDLVVVVTLLNELASKFEASNAYTFDEAISFLPEELGYPPEFAFKILENLGYKPDNSAAIL